MSGWENVVAPVEGPAPAVNERAIVSEIIGGSEQGVVLAGLFDELSILWDRAGAARRLLAASVGEQVAGRLDPTGEIEVALDQGRAPDLSGLRARIGQIAAARAAADEVNEAIKTVWGVRLNDMDRALGAGKDLARARLDGLVSETVGQARTIADGVPAEPADAIRAGKSKQWQKVTDLAGRYAVLRRAHLILEDDTPLQGVGGQLRAPALWLREPWTVEPGFLINAVEHRTLFADRQVTVTEPVSWPADPMDHEAWLWWLAGDPVGRQAVAWVPARGERDAQFAELARLAGEAWAARQENPARPGRDAYDAPHITGFVRGGDVPGQARLAAANEYSRHVKAPIQAAQQQTAFRD